MKYSLPQMACKVDSSLYKDLLLSISEPKGFLTLILMSVVSGEQIICGVGGKNAY